MERCAVPLFNAFAALLIVASAVGQEAPTLKPTPADVEPSATVTPASPAPVNPVLAQPKADIDLDGWIGVGLQKHGGTLQMYESFAGLGGSSGYTVTVYTPERWVQRLAYDAAVKYLPFSAANLSAEDLRDVLRVTIEPSTPRKVAAGYAGSSVEHVVIRDTGRSEAIQPLTIEYFEETVQNALGATVTFRGASAVFSMPEVERLRGLDGKAKREFLITVIGDGRGEKDFHVKQRHFADFGRE